MPTHGLPQGVDLGDLGRKIKQSGRELNIRQLVVTAVNDGVATVDLDGEPVEVVHLASYLPIPGDVVWVLEFIPDYLILGSLTPRTITARLHKNSSQSIPDSVNTQVSWQDAAGDVGEFADLANDRFVIPAGVTKVRLGVQARFAANATGGRRVIVLRNGSTFHGMPELSTAANPESGVRSTVGMASLPVAVAEGDTFTVSARQSSGGGLNIESISTWFAIEAV